jgi:succinate dehydrogenase/fumarate reductase cytochrome b subunit
MIDKITSFFVGTVHAQNFDIFHPFDITPGDNATDTFTGLVGTVITWVLAVVAVIAFVYLIISGVNYITAGGDAEKATKARTGIINAIIGIVVVVLSYFILSFAVSLGKNLVGQ